LINITIMHHQYVPIYLSIYLSIFQSLNQSMYLSIISIYLSYLSIYLFPYPSLNQSMYLSFYHIYQSVYLSIYHIDRLRLQVTCIQKCRIMINCCSSFSSSSFIWRISYAAYQTMVGDSTRLTASNIDIYLPAKL